ncbi:hypothetical protein, partial [Segatella buccae]|uniref:hypothetical protein n=1 Tax=Segatella buccae TaxID=28126 RepID=UPI0028E8A3D9
MRIKNRKKSALLLVLSEILIIFVALSNLNNQPQLKSYNKLKYKQQHNELFIATNHANSARSFGNHRAGQY